MHVVAGGVLLLRLVVSTLDWVIIPIDESNRF